MYRHIGKRLLDITLSAGALVVLSPLLAAVAALVWLEDRGTPIYRQERVGRNQQRFVILKFRSMPINSAAVSSRDISTPTITRVGRVIRRLNLDELPQLINILVGNMSVVGPRPALPTQSELISMRQELGVFRVTPGLTGLAQVESYDDMPEAVKADKDARYARKVTLLGDAKIIIRTFNYLLNPPPKY